MCIICDKIINKNYCPSQTIYLRNNEVSDILFSRDVPRLEDCLISRNTKGYLLVDGDNSSKRDSPRLVDCLIARKRDAPRLVVCLITQKRDAPRLVVYCISRKRVAPRHKDCLISPKKDTINHASLLMPPLYRIYIQLLKSCFYY